jgi:DNA-binding transcriptional LysR family regulator
MRTTRRVAVTPDGAAFYERCAHILADLDDAEASVMQAHVAPKARLRVDMLCAAPATHSYQQASAHALSRLPRDGSDSS